MSLFLLWLYQAGLGVLGSVGWGLTGLGLIFQAVRGRRFFF
jgi:hypothetical protein